MPGNLTADTDDLADPGMQVTRNISIMGLLVGRRHEHLDVAADHLVRGIAEYLLHCPVGRLNNALFINGDNTLRGMIEDGKQTRLTVAQSHLCPPVLVHLCLQPGVCLVQLPGARPQGHCLGMAAAGKPDHEPEYATHPHDGSDELTT